mgnify:CR=1 FL=1
MVARLDRYFVLTGLVFAGIGLMLGEHMGRTGNHGQMPTHAHIMLAGFVMPVIYGALYRLWPTLKAGRLPLVHYALHLLGALALIIALYLYYGGIAEEASLIALFAAGPAGIILGLLLFLVLFFLKGKDA